MDFQDNKFILNFFVEKESSDLQLADISNIAQVIIAIINVGLLIYIFCSDRKRSKEAKIDEENKNFKSIKLQGFKDFIITPNFPHLQDFFSNLLTLKRRINSSQINDELSIELNSFIKTEVSKFRVNFNDAILNVNRDLFDKIKLKIENLSDNLITVISDGEFNLTDPELFITHIESPINYAKNEIVALIITYKGD